MLCCLHQRYATLWEELAAALQKALQADVDAADSTAVLRRRALLKLAVEADLRGILPTARMLQPVIAELVRRLAACPFLPWVQPPAKSCCGICVRRHLCKPSQRSAGACQSKG